MTLFESYNWPFRRLGRRKTKQLVCALLSFLMRWAWGQSQRRLASARHYGNLSMPTFHRQGLPASKWNRPAGIEAPAGAYPRPGNPDDGRTMPAEFFQLLGIEPPPERQVLTAREFIAFCLYQHYPNE